MKRIILALAMAAMTIMVMLPAIAQGDDKLPNTSIAQAYLIDSPTFTFDGIPESISLIKQCRQREFTFTFECSHSGYGDRSGAIIAPAIIPHRAVIAVNRRGRIIYGVIDNCWNMEEQAPTCWNNVSRWKRFKSRMACWFYQRSWSR